MWGTPLRIQHQAETAGQSRLRDAPKDSVGMESSERKTARVVSAIYLRCLKPLHIGFPAANR